MKYKKFMRSPKIKVSFYNEDNGKLIGEPQWTAAGRLDQDQYW
jgi:hypothetical protein